MDKLAEKIAEEKGGTKDFMAKLDPKDVEELVHHTGLPPTLCRIMFALTPDRSLKEIKETWTAAVELHDKGIRSIDILPQTHTHH